jgi:hypothetical protein
MPEPEPYVNMVERVMRSLHVAPWRKEDMRLAGYEAIAKALVRKDLRNPPQFIYKAILHSMQAERRKLDRISRNEISMGLFPGEESE